MSSRPLTSSDRGGAVRARLLTAAGELIGEIGWNAVSTRNVAERAGAGAGLVHYHFDSLQALLRRAALAEMDRALESAAAAFQAESGLTQGIEAMLAEIDGYTGTDPSSLLLTEAYLAATRDAELREQMTARMVVLRDALSSALARAGHARAEAAAILILAVLDGLILQKGLDPHLSAGQIAPLLRQLTTPEQ